MISWMLTTAVMIPLVQKFAPCLHRASSRPCGLRSAQRRCTESGKFRDRPPLPAGTLAFPTLAIRTSNNPAYTAPIPCADLRLVGSLFLSHCRRCIQSQEHGRSHVHNHERPSNAMLGMKSDYNSKNWDSKEDSSRPIPPPDPVRGLSPCFDALIFSCCFFLVFYRFNQDFVQVCENVKKLLFNNLKRFEIIHRRSTRETSTGSTKAETAHSRLEDIAHVHAHLKMLCLDCLRGTDSVVCASTFDNPKA